MQTESSFEEFMVFVAILAAVVVLLSTNLLSWHFGFYQGTSDADRMCQGKPVVRP